jgi:hypothetical protein
MIEIKGFKAKKYDYIEPIYSGIIQNIDGDKIVMPRASLVERLTLDFNENLKDEKKGVIDYIKVDYSECYKKSDIEITEEIGSKKITIRKHKKYLIDYIKGLEINIEPKILTTEEIFSDEELREMLIAGSRFLIRVWEATKFSHRIAAGGVPEIISRRTKYVLEAYHYPKYENTMLYVELKEFNEGSNTLYFKKHIENLEKTLKPHKFHIKTIDENTENIIEIGNIKINIKEIPPEENENKY